MEGRVPPRPGVGLAETDGDCGVPGLRTAWKPFLKGGSACMEGRVTPRPNEKRGAHGSRTTFKPALQGCNRHGCADYTRSDGTALNFPHLFLCPQLDSPASDMIASFSSSVTNPASTKSSDACATQET